MLHCGYCKHERITDFEPFDSFDELLSKVLFYHIDREFNIWLSPNWREKPMTPEEELYKYIFNEETELCSRWVKDMDVLPLRAHREMLVKIIKEARIRVSAVDAAEGEIRKKKGILKPSGFERSLNADEVATEAINTVRERAKKLTRQEKLQENLAKLYALAGHTSTDANKEAKDKMKAATILSATNPEQAKEVKKLSERSELKPFSNPFGKKE